METNCRVQPMKTEKIDEIVMEIQVQPKESQQVHVEHHHHHHHHHYHHHIHDVQRHPTLTNQDHCLATATVGCASSNAFTETGEGNDGNFSMNGSGSGSQHGSNGKDGSQHGSNQPDLVTHTDNDNALVRNSSDDIVNTNSVSNGSDEDRFSQRDAALTTFRQKRKERSFEKKVRKEVSAKCHGLNVLITKSCGA
uniref:Uncharacterized protein n=1 Tax=Kalanchoe fedtschenkoi TaxID=63787 RepID=A0A7N1A978_KALFE